MTGRSVPEWIGSTPDSVPPPHVKLRIFRDHDGRCHISGRKILAGERWELEHVKPLHMDGENRESNLAPALIEPHKQKSKAEMAAKGKADRVAKRHLGLARSRNPLPGGKRSRWKRKLNGEVVPR